MISSNRSLLQINPPTQTLHDNQNLFEVHGPRACVKLELSVPMGN